MVTEQEAATFSSEDSANALIPCALSAVAYELLPNFKAILASDQARQHKIKLFDVLVLISDRVPTFLHTGNRFRDLVAPEIDKAIERLEAGDMLLVMLVKAQAALMNSIVQGLESSSGSNGEQPSSEAEQSLLEMVKGQRSVLKMKVDHMVSKRIG